MKGMKTFLGEQHVNACYCYLKKLGASHGTVTRSEWHPNAPTGSPEIWQPA